MKYTIVFGIVKHYTMKTDIIIIIIIIIIPVQVFHISVSWWFLTGIWVTASLLKSPGLFSVLWLISTVQVSSSLQDSSQYSGWSQQCCSLDGLHLSSYFQVRSPCINPSVAVPRAPITFGIIVTFMFQIPSQGPGTYPSFRFLSILLCGLPGQQSPQFWSGRLAEIRWSVCISKSQRSLCDSFSG